VGQEGPITPARSHRRHPPGIPLPSEEGTIQNVLRAFTWKPGAESGLDCLVCAEFARHQATGSSSAPAFRPAPPTWYGTGDQELLYINVQRFRGGVVFKAHRLCVSLNSRLESNNEEEEEEQAMHESVDPSSVERGIDPPLGINSTCTSRGTTQLVLPTGKSQLVTLDPDP